MDSPVSAKTIVRPARPEDVDAVSRLLSVYAERKILLARSREEVSRRIGSFLVADDGGAVIGCVSVETFEGGLAEIRSLAVDERAQGTGTGRALVEGALDLCRRRGACRVFVLTYVARFFRKLGFRPVSKGIFPEKVWGECIRCPHYYNCDEDALLLELGDPAPGAD